jgi:hypothetical protein
MLTFFTFQTDGQARIDQFDLDETRWKAGLIDSAWPFSRDAEDFITQVPFDHLYIGSGNSTVKITGFVLFTAPLKTDQIHTMPMNTGEYALLSNGTLGCHVLSTVSVRATHVRRLVLG